MAAIYKDKEVLLHKHFERILSCLALEFSELPKPDTQEYLPLLHSLRTMVTAATSSLNEQLQRLERLEVDPKFYVELIEGFGNFLEKINTRLRLIDEEIDRKCRSLVESA